MESLEGDASTIATTYSAILEASDGVVCSGVITTPPLGSGVSDASEQSITCQLANDAQTTCTFSLSVLPHPPLECPAPPALPIRSDSAAQQTQPFGTGSVSCSPATPADIPPEEFPTVPGNTAPSSYTVTCASSDTPNTCAFDVSLLGPERALRF